VALAAPEGYVRRVIDDVGPVVHLLSIVRSDAPAFVDAVLDGLGTGAETVPIVGRRRADSLWHDEHGRPFEALSPREFEVLRLLAAGYSDAAIAENLVVSIATARWHTAHIRAKLGVRSRAQAVVRARALGLA
jgi:DNA-binding CsgD family transcriptional regulator